MVSTQLKNISQNGNLPQIGVKKKIFETTTKIYFWLQLRKKYEGLAEFQAHPNFCPEFRKNQDMRLTNV